jgi:hypothetical protein
MYPYVIFKNWPQKGLAVTLVLLSSICTYMGVSPGGCPDKDKNEKISKLKKLGV